LLFVGSARGEDPTGSQTAHASEISRLSPSCGVGNLPIISILKEPRGKLSLKPKKINLSFIYSDQV
jgi:hypothetical protein